MGSRRRGSLLAAPRPGGAARRALPALATFVGICAAPSATHGVSVLVPEAEVAAPVISPVSAIQDFPSLACHDQGCLMVARSPRQSAYQLWGTRLTSAGVPADPASFLLSLAAGYNDSPAIATDGQRFVVAWRSSDAGIGVTTVEADGTSHDQQVSATASLGPAIAYGGGGYLVLARGTDPVGGGPAGVAAFRLDGAGHVVDGQPIFVTASATATLPSAVWTGNQFLVVWHETPNQTTDLAYAARVRADGTVLDPGGFLVSTLSGFSNAPQLAFGGDTVMMVAGRRSSAAGGNVDVVLLDADGKNPRRVALPGTPASLGLTGHSVSVAWNGSAFVVSWIQNLSQVIAARISPAGQVLDGSGLLLASPTITQDTRVAVSNGVAYIVYIDQTYPNQLVRLRSVAPDGTVGHQSDPPLVRSAQAQQLMATARGAGSTLVVWADQEPGSSLMSPRAARVDDSGAVLDRPALSFLPASAGNGKGGAAAVWGGDQFLVAWLAQAGTSVANVLVARVSSDGRLLDPSPVALATNLIGNWAISAAWDGHNFLVSWVQVSAGARATGQLVSPAGHPVGALLTLGTNGGAGAPTGLLGVGDGFLVGWCGNTTQLSHLADDGTQTAPAGLADVQASSSLALIPAPPNILVWINGRTGVYLAGTAPYSAIGAPFTLPGAIGTPSFVGAAGPADADAGQDAGADGGAAPTVGLISASVTTSGLYSTTGVDVNLVSTAGALVGPATSIVDPLLPVSNPQAVALGGGRNLIVYSRLVPDSGFGALRVRYQIVDSQPRQPPDAGADMDGGGDGGGDGVGDAGRADSPTGPDAVDAAAPDAGGRDRGASDAADAGAVHADAADAGDTGETRVADSDAFDAFDAFDAGADTAPTRDHSGCRCDLQVASARGNLTAIVATLMSIGLLLALRAPRRRAADRRNGRAQNPTAST